MSIVTLVAPQAAAMAAVTIAERIWNPVKTDWARNLLAWVLALTVAFTLLPLLPEWAGPSLVDTARLPFWAGLLLFFVVRDFCEFAYHVAQHRIPVLWAMHALHHSDPEMTALTTNRHFWGDQLIKQVTVWTLSLMVVRPTDGVFAAYAFISLYNYAIHADIRVDFGRWSWLLNSPAYHRRHHSRQPEHHGSNFAAVLPIWDVLLGSYRRPDSWPECGLDHAPDGPLEVIAWPFLEARRMGSARTARDATA